MAGKARWTRTARRSLIDTLSFWKRHNKSSFYSLRINSAIENRIEQLLANPKLSLYDSSLKKRKSLVENFYIIYLEDAEGLVIHYIWDCRRNPSDMITEVEMD